MQGMNNMKLINTKQASIIRHYKNTKQKLLEAKAAI
jgi:hypothetical protein